MPVIIYTNTDNEFRTIWREAIGFADMTPSNECHADVDAIVLNVECLAIQSR